MVREKEPKAQHVSDFVETGVSTREKPAKERTIQQQAWENKKDPMLLVYHLMQRR